MTGAAIPELNFEGHHADHCRHKANLRVHDIPKGVAHPALQNKAAERSPPERRGLPSSWREGNHLAEKISWWQVSARLWLHKVHRIDRSSRLSSRDDCEAKRKEEDEENVCLSREGF